MAKEMIYVSCAYLISYLMTVKITGHWKITLHEASLYTNPLFFLVTVYHFIKSFFREKIKPNQVIESGYLSEVRTTAQEFQRAMISLDKKIKSINDMAKTLIKD